MHPMSLCIWLWIKSHCELIWLGIKWQCELLHGCMVYAEHVPRRQQCNVAPAIWQPNSAVSRPLWWTFKYVLYKTALIQGCIRLERSGSAPKQRTMLYSCHCEALWAHLEMRCSYCYCYIKLSLELALARGYWYCHYWQVFNFIVCSQNIGTKAKYLCKEYLFRTAFSCSNQLS